MVQTKSRHHKEENTHRFLTLAERLANLNVDVVKRINRAYVSKPEETETYFHQTLVKWLDLNYSAVFNEFTAKIRHKCHSLAQLVFHQETLVNHLIEFINRADPLSLQPILELTAQFARDLQVDFYRHFPSIFQSIVGLLDTQETDVLEWSFQTLSYLFKFLWRYMLKDLENVYALYSPLLNESRKVYIRNFSAESIAFLMRKVADKSALFDFLLFRRLVENPAEMDGIGRLIFEMFKGVKHQFNACTHQSLAVLLTKINNINNNNNNEYDNQHKELVFNCIGKTIEAMASYTKKEHCNLVWKCFYNSIDNVTNASLEIDNEKRLVQSTYLMRLMHLFLNTKNCHLIDDLDALLDSLTKLSKLEFSSSVAAARIKFTECFMQLGQNLLLSENVKFEIQKANVLPTILYQPRFDSDLVVALTKQLFAHAQFETIILPHVISYFDQLASADAQTNSCRKFLDLLVDYLVTHKNILDSELVEKLKSTTNGTTSSTFERFVKIKDLSQLVRLFTVDVKRFTNLKLATCLEKLLIGDMSMLCPHNESSNEYLTKLSHAFLIIPIVFPTSRVLIEQMEKQAANLLKQMNSDLDNDNSVSLFESRSFVFSLSQWSSMMVGNQRTQNTGDDLIKSLIGVLKRASSSSSWSMRESSKGETSVWHILRALNYQLSMLGDSTESSLSRSLQFVDETALNVIKSHLSSPNHDTRLNVLNILAVYFRAHTSRIGPIKLTPDGDEEMLVDLFEIAVRAETTSASLDSFRKKVFFLQRLDTNVCSKYFQIDAIRDVPLRYFFGVLFENFKLVWEPVVTLVQNYANFMKANDFWTVFYDYFSRLADKIEAQSSAKEETSEDELATLKSAFTGEELSQHSVDYMNNRLLLCQAMKGFAGICESKTKTLVPIFFRFMNNEYYSMGENNRLLSTALEDITITFSERQSSEKTAKERYHTKKLLNKHLCAYLDVFALFTSPKSWHQEENLRSLYLNLLCHQEASVQKAALKCLYTYQYSFVTPYKEHLEKLLEGKHFRHELVIFSLDATNGVVHSDDRQKLLPLLMRMLYGKFHSNETTHTSSKDTKSNKRSTIIQFLSQCSEYELNFFFNLIFDCINTSIARLETTTTAADEQNLNTNLNESGRHKQHSRLINDTNRFEYNSNELEASARDRQLECILQHLTDDNDNDNDGQVYDMKQCVPFKKILGVLQSLEIVMRKLARQMESFAHRILRMLGFIHKYAATLFDKIQAFKKKAKKRDDQSEPEKSAAEVHVDDYYLNLLKIIRQQVTLRFKQFFETYDHLNFTPKEYFYIYETFVWPQAIRVPHESLKSVSNMLKILSAWSTRPRYYPLLVVRSTHFFDRPDNEDDAAVSEKSLSNRMTTLAATSFRQKSLLDILFELVDSPQCSQLVINHVIDMVHNFVSFADFVEDESDHDHENGFVTRRLPFKLDFVFEQFQNDSTDGLNLGTMILRPYVGSIVNHVERIVVNSMSKRTLPAKPLKILARLSVFASNSSEQCEKIILLLIPYLIKNKKQDEETQINILNSINHLMRKVSNVDDFICPLSRLFVVIGHRQSRVELCNIFQTIKQMNVKFEFISNVVNDLNSWDPKRLEEPDYMKRLDAYKRLNDTVQSWTEFDQQVASILIYNCFHFIKNLGDLALKESSTHCVVELLRKTSTLQLSKSDKHLLEANFLAELKSGLKSKVENARHEFISILVVFVRSFGQVFTAYNDLAVLFDDEDVEKDFYENIKHIQMHRRARALKRLQRTCAEGLLSTETLTNFLMPLVRAYLDNDMYYKYDYLVEDACKALGAICGRLAWPKYVKILELYLKSLVKAKNINNNNNNTTAAADGRKSKKSSEENGGVMSAMNQKIVIKIICFILDSFHFDLSLSNKKDYFSDPGESLVVADQDGEEAKTEQEKEKRPRKTLVGSAMAFKIHTHLSQSIIPTLFKCLTKRLRSEGEHKANKREDESEQILRVPIALALLKLLINLPSRTFETHLPGLLFKVCDMLKSRAISVRTSTRECLIKMVDALPHKRYYSFVFRELANALSRGYQVHVLCFTVYEVLRHVESSGPLQCGDLDSSLDVLMSSVHLELFTDVSEEKEVKQIVAKTLEAKTVSSYGTLEILGKYVSSKSTLRIIMPFKEQLDTCNSKKLLKKIEDALRRVLLGFMANSCLSTDDLMKLVHGLLNDTFEVLKDPSKFKKKNRLAKKAIGRGSSKQNENDDDDNDAEADEKRRKVSLQKSCLLIQSEPKRGGEKPKVLAKTNQHVIVEFGLQLLHNLIKQNRLNDPKPIGEAQKQQQQQQQQQSQVQEQPQVHDKNGEETTTAASASNKYKLMLDPYVSMFTNYLDGKYLKVTILTLRCLLGVMRFGLPSLERHSREIGAKLFILLRTFSSASTMASTNASSGDNFELLTVCYKLMASLIRDCSQFSLTDEQLQVLLHAAERNLYDVHKQAATFNLLKAIVTRRDFECDELADVMGRVMKLSIQAESAAVRVQARQTCMAYLLASAGSEQRLLKIVEFYVVQLNYEYEDGRESAIEMLATMFNTFPITKLNDLSALFFLPLAVQLHNDESAKCKKLAWMALKSLLEKIDVEHRDALFEITRSLFCDHEKPLHKRIAALLTKLFVECEKQQFSRRLDTVLEILKAELDSQKYITQVEENSSTLINEKFYDQYLFNLLTLFMKILTECRLIENGRHTQTVNTIFDQVKVYLTHEHMWVRLISCQLFGHLFAVQSIEDLLNPNKKSYFTFSTNNKFMKIRDLIDAFCQQFKSPVLDNEQAEQIMKNMAFMAKLINRSESELEQNQEALSAELGHDINMLWLIKKMLKEAKFELVNKPKETMKRTHVFKWIAAVVHELGREKVQKHIHLLMGVLQREIVIDQNDESLKRLAHEVLEFVKQIVGVEEFSANLAKSSKRRMENKEERKRKMAQTAILDPQLAAMKKIRKMQKKKDAKKRKMEGGSNGLKNGSKKRKMMKNRRDNDDF